MKNLKLGQFDELISELTDAHAYQNIEKANIVKYHIADLVKLECNNEILTLCNTIIEAIENEIELKQIIDNLERDINDLGQIIDEMEENK